MLAASGAAARVKSALCAEPGYTESSAIQDIFLCLYMHFCQFQTTGNTSGFMSKCVVVTVI